MTYLEDPSAPKPIHDGPGVPGDATADAAVESAANDGDVTASLSPDSDPTATLLTPPPLPSVEVPRRSRAKLAVAALGLVGIAGGGVFAYSQITGGEKANTPEQAVESLYRALETGDFVGMSKTLAPGERDVFLDSMVPMVSELSRLEILKRDLSLDKVDGIKSKLTNFAATHKMLRDDLAAVTITSGELNTSIDPKKLPYGDFLKKNFGDAIDSARETTSSSSISVGTKQSPIVVQKVGERWYLSMNYSIAYNGQDESKKVPARGAGVPAKGAASAEAAVSEFMQAGANLDVRRVIELLPPDEFAALHDYAGDFIDDAERDLADVRKQYNFAVKPKLTTISLADDRKLVQIVDLPMKFDATINEQKIAVEYENKTAKALFTSAEGEDLRAEYRNNCATITLSGETKKGCGQQEISKLIGDLVGVPLDANSIPISTNGANGVCGKFAKAQTGFTAIKRDGLWYVSPFRTVLDDLTAVMKPVDRKALDCIVDEIKKATSGNDSGDSADFELDDGPVTVDTIGGIEESFSVDTFAEDTSAV
jgi:hypothetical protein